MPKHMPKHKSKHKPKHMSKHAARRSRSRPAARQRTVCPARGSRSVSTSARTSMRGPTFTSGGLEMTYFRGTMQQAAPLRMQSCAAYRARHERETCRTQKDAHGRTNRPTHSGASKKVPTVEGKKARTAGTINGPRGRTECAVVHSRQVG